MAKRLSREYLDYIASPAWRNVRSLVLKRDNARCRDCGSKSLHNDVHHLTYIRLGTERLDDLITLCRECHNKRHGVAVKVVKWRKKKKSKNRKRLSDMTVKPARTPEQAARERAKRKHRRAA